MDDVTGAEVFIDFTNEELLLLAELLDVEPPPGVGVKSLAELSVAGNVERLRSAALASLQARGIVSGIGDSPEVTEAVREVIGAFANPGAMVAAAHERNGLMETRFYAAMPEIAIEHRGLSISLHRFVPFATRDLLARVLNFVDLRPYMPDATLSFTVSEKVLDDVVARMEAHGANEAVEVLGDNGVEGKVAQGFVSALTMKQSTTSVTILHRPAEETVEGGALSWMDAGLTGLWVTEPHEQSEDLLDVRLMDARSVAGELLSYLPNAFGEHGLVL